MPVTQHGVVYYADDPTQSAFRAVYPTVDDAELNDPSFTTIGVDPARPAVLKRVPVGEAACAPWATPWSTVRDNVLGFAATAPAVKAVRDTPAYAVALTAARAAAVAAAEADDATPETILSAAQAAALAAV